LISNSNKKLKKSKIVQKSFNFLYWLNQDLSIKIISMLDIQSATASLLTCKDMIRLLPYFPKKVFANVVVKDEMIDSKSISSAIRLFGPSISSFKLYFNDGVSQNLPILLLDRCPNLREIEMIGVFKSITLNVELLEKLNKSIILEKFWIAGSLSCQALDEKARREFEILEKNHSISLDFGRCMFENCLFVGEICQQCKRIFCKSCFPIAICMECGQNFCYDCVEIETCEKCLVDFCARCREVNYCIVCEKSCCEVCEPAKTCPMTFSFYF
jgi:hypothetical protein